MKQQILEKMKELAGNPNTKSGDDWNDLKDFIESLPDEKPQPKPTRFDFQFPIPNGFEAVTRDGRKVEQLKHFDFQGGRIIGVAGDNMVTSNKYGINTLGSTDSDLFLRPIEIKLWVVQWPNGERSVSEENPRNIPTATIFEATLKQINQQS
ncbi:MAG: hypothetical protein KAF40_00280 [Flavihumibacter sp.]|nr:hypothetical protein [Flavihumibacter sp.]